MPVWLLKYLPHIVAVAAIAGGVWWFSSARYDAGYAAAEAAWRETLTTAAVDYAAQLEVQQETLDATAKQLDEARRAGRNAREELDDALNTPDGRTWGDTPLPDSIRLSLDAARHPPVPTDPE